MKRKNYSGQVEDSIGDLQLNVLEIPIYYAFQ